MRLATAFTVNMVEVIAITTSICWVLYADAIADFDVPNLDVVTNLWALLWAAAASTAVAVPVEIRGAVGWRANTSAFVFVPVVTLTAEVGFALAATVCRGIGVTVPVLVSWADLRFADAFAFFVVPVFTK